MESVGLMYLRRQGALGGTQMAKMNLKKDERRHVHFHAMGFTPFRANVYTHFNRDGVSSATQ